MKRTNFIFFIPICIVVLSVLSCKEKGGGSQSSSMNGDGGNTSNEEIVMHAQYTKQGMLINTPVRISHEITYKGGKVVTEKSTSKSHQTSMTVLQFYDSKGRLERLVSERDGKVAITQDNSYTEDDLLLREFRIEKNDDGNDTILYEYHYPEDRPNPLHYYRTNNGQKVTEMTLTKDGNIEVLEERAFGNENYIGINTLTRKKDDDGNVIEEQQINISSDWGDMTKLDTSVYEPVYYKYDDKGRMIRKESDGILEGNGVTVNHYTDDGVIVKKEITNRGKPKRVIKFRRIN